MKAIHVPAARELFLCQTCMAMYEPAGSHVCSAQRAAPIAPESVAGGYVLILVMVAVITALFGAALWLLTK